MTIKGMIYKVFKTEQKTDTFRVRSFVLKTAQQYSPFISMQLVNDNCEVFESEGIEENDMVRVDFELGGKSYADRHTGEEKFFNTVTAYKVVIDTEK